MSNIQFPGSKQFDLLILMHSYTHKKGDGSLAKQVQNNMSKEHRKRGVIDHIKYRKIDIKRKWTDKEYHVQDNSDVPHKDVKVYCDDNRFPSLPFCGPHPKPHGARGLSKRYHLRFDPKLSHGICAILCIPCACVRCTSMLDKPWISGIPSKKKERYQPVTNFNYWPVLGSLLGP